MDDRVGRITWIGCLGEGQSSRRVTSPTSRSTSPPLAGPRFKPFFPGVVVSFPPPNHPHLSLFTPRHHPITAFHFIVGNQNPTIDTMLPYTFTVG